MTDPTNENGGGLLHACNPPMGEAGAETKKKHVWEAEPDAVGMARHGDIIQAWSIQDGAAVQVFAKQVYGDDKYVDCWNVTATIDCEKAIIATVFGGRNRMNAIARFLRNGLLAARLRPKHKRMNKKARANAEKGEADGKSE